MIKTHLGIFIRKTSEELTCESMVRLAKYFWVLAYKYIFLLFGFFFRYIFRLYSAESADSSKKEDSNFDADHFQQDLQQDDQIALVSETEEENHDFVFKFQFQNCQTERSVSCETVSHEPERSISRDYQNHQNTSKHHQFNSTKDYRGFIEEPEAVSCFVQELFASPNDQNSWEFDSEANKSIVSTKTEDSVFQENSLISTEDIKGFTEEPERLTYRPQDFSFSFGLSNFQAPENEYNSKAKNFIASGKTEDSNFQSNLPNQKTSKISMNYLEFRGFIENPEVIQDFLEGPNDFQIVDHGNQDFGEFDSETEDSVTPEQSPLFSSDCSFQGEKETTGLEISHLGVANFSREVGLKSWNQYWSFDFEPKTSVSSEEVDSITSDYFANSLADEEEETEFTEGKIPIPAEISFLKPRVSCTDDEFIEFEPDFISPKSEQETEEGKSELPKSPNKSSSWHNYYDDDEDEDDDLFGDVLSKHRESIEQMKAEMKNAKGKGTLPTILEESECPKVVEDLKPLMRIDEKLELQDRLEEIQKVYKGYAEKMRKLDVLDYQTLHGISFIQLKDQIRQGSAQTSTVSAIKSLLLPNLLQIKPRRIYADPTLKSITDLHRNLELIYVGQTCLSWEILIWQYRKAIEIKENECEGNTSSYNHVAGEFQQFQVLLERFIEDEPFQGFPRVQNYAKNRCDTRSILQVPVIKEDSSKDKKDSTVWEDYEVSAEMLTNVIDESIRAFWEFLEADKDEANVILKVIQPTYYVDLQDPSDSELLMNIKTSLQKKDKRLKDLLRSRNCLAKKFQKHQESRLRGALLFAQVELKLVSRVLNMSRLTTDQLVWCQKKLNKINIVHRKKLQLEPSFLLFPF